MAVLVVDFCEETAPKVGNSSKVGTLLSRLVSVSCCWEHVLGGTSLEVEHILPGKLAKKLS